MKIIDCRNLACPAPVVTTKQALAAASGETLRVLVDDGAPRENVTRFARSRGLDVRESEAEGGGYCLTLSGAAVPAPQGSSGFSGGGRVMLVTSDRLGDGPDDLGRLLMKNFIITLLELETPPDRMLFLNTGVLLTTEGSEVAEALNRLVNRGVEVMSCGVCLDFFHKKDKVSAGTVTNMFTIVESLHSAASVLRP